MRRVTRVEPPRPTPPIAQRMATRIVETFRLRGECLERDLIQAGFTAADLRAHGDAARAIAGARLGPSVMEGPAS